MSLRVLYIKDLPAMALADQARTLGVIGFGPAVPAGDGPQLAIGLAPLTPNSTIEVWTSDRSVQTGHANGVTYATDGEVLFGAISFDEAALPSLEALSQDVYARLFAFLDRSVYPQLFRVWNYIPAITADAGGMERYRRFNIGRHAAFAEHYHRIQHPPAATGIGSFGGQPSFYFLAIKGAVAALENPRQVSAYHYPTEYGPRSPTFSRAGIGSIGDQRHLAISGTASIVGHASLHPGDAAAQTRETLENIRLLLAAAAAGRGLTIAAQDLALKVYIRSPSDFPAIRQIIEAEFGCPQVCYLQAEICRAELLVEIEAFR